MSARDPFDLTDDPAPAPTAPSPDGTFRALVLPLRHYQDAFEAELLGRVRGDKVQIKVSTGTIFAVDRFRLHAIEKGRGVGRRRLTDAEMDALPWKGAGEDPLLQASAAKAPPWSEP